VMKYALRVAGVGALILFVLSARAALAGAGAVGAPELDASLTVAGLALLGGTAAFAIERYRRRTK
jgi:hypothetical protein